mmetsp:Transcript_14717/g.29421  ORF Transcript_14717/g.29421 Transcript_14717/m.29421 type:complete len:216 (+) Transcript_14717:361-1008(+)
MPCRRHEAPGWTPQKTCAPQLVPSYGSDNNYVAAPLELGFRCRLPSAVTGLAAPLLVHLGGPPFRPLPLMSELFGRHHRPDQTLGPVPAAQRISQLFRRRQQPHVTQSKQPADQVELVDGVQFGRAPILRDLGTTPVQRGGGPVVDVGHRVVKRAIPVQERKQHLPRAVVPPGEQVGAEVVRHQDVQLEGAQASRERRVQVRLSEDHCGTSMPAA